MVGDDAGVLELGRRSVVDVFGPAVGGGVELRSSGQEHRFDGEWQPGHGDGAVAVVHAVADVGIGVEHHA